MAIQQILDKCIAITLYPEVNGLQENTHKELNQIKEKAAYTEYEILNGIEVIRKT